jgi:pyrroloquinoline-quinone synthase
MSHPVPVVSSEHTAFIEELDALIAARKKMTSRLYQVILSGEAPQRLLQQFVIHRYPIKNHWTRNILGIASRVDDYVMRRELVENIYEEETGAMTRSKRHLETFIEFGESLGLTREQIVNAPERLAETDAMVAHNVRVCNSGEVHFTEGVASVLLLMEGQPPIVSRQGRSMEVVMRDVYRLPLSGYTYFTYHASSMDGSTNVSELEDDHASTARHLLARYCVTPEQRRAARDALARAIELRHRHFDAILERYHEPSAPPFRYQAGASHG